jgi:hypothetical protein
MKIRVRIERNDGTVLKEIVWSPNYAYTWDAGPAPIVADGQRLFGFSIGVLGDRVGLPDTEPELDDWCEPDMVV